MTSKTPRLKDPETLDDTAVELATLLAEIFHAGKRRGGDPPPELEAAAEQENLGPRHAPILFAVALDGGVSVSELAERVGLTVATTSLLVGELSRAGILARTEDERDRRRTIVSISPEHERSVGRWVRRVVEPMRRVLTELPPRARADFMRGVRLLAAESDRAVINGDDPANA